MLENDSDKTMARNQIIAIILMTLVVILWSTFFMPSPAPVKPAAAPNAPAAGQTRPAEAETPIAQTVSEPGAGAWPFLPPPAGVESAGEDVILEDDNLRLVFTAVGGRLKQAYAKLRQHKESEVALIPVPEAPDAPTEYPLGLRFSDSALGEALNTRLFAVEQDPAGRQVRFVFDAPNGVRVVKTFALSDVPYVMMTNVDFTSLEAPGSNRQFGIDQTPAFWLTWAPGMEYHDNKSFMTPEFVFQAKGVSTNVGVGSLAGEGERFFPGAEWTALKSVYLTIAMKADFTQAGGFVSGDDKRFVFGLGAPRFDIGGGETRSAQFTVYLGPTQRDFMETAWPGLPSVVRFFSQFWNWMDIFAKMLLNALNWLYNNVYANYGVAIILLTLAIRIVLYPLTLKSTRSMKRMQLLAPEMQVLKEKYGADQQDYNKRVMEMYRERGVNPMGGCLPMLLQTPVFIAFYRMLASTYELRGAPFMIVSWGDYQWIADLSEPDKLMHLAFMKQVPFIGATFEYINLLPILMALAIYLSQKMMPMSGPAQNDQQRIIMNIMPVFMGFVCYSMASGLSLYILTSTLLGIAQNKLISSSNVAIPEKKAAPKKRRHFYVAAQERKRRLAKEQKENRKNSPAGKDKK